MAITTDNLCVLCKEPLGHIEGNVHGPCVEGYLTLRYKDKMSWQEEYVARYEARLREKWTTGGKCISNPWDTVSATGYKIPFEEAKVLPTLKHPTMKGVPKLTWSAEEIARTLGLSIQFIRNEMHAGHLLSHKYGRRRLVRTQDLETYVERGSEGSKTNKDNYSTE